MRIERRGGGGQSERILPSVPAAALNESQEKGKVLPLLLSICEKQLPRSSGWSLVRGGGRTEGEEEEEVPEPGTESTYMGCVLSSDWCGEEEVQPVPVVRNPSLKRSESGRMRLTKVSVHVELL